MKPGSWCLNIQLQPWALGNWKNETVDLSGRDELPLEDGSALGTQSWATIPPLGKEAAEVVQHVIMMAPGLLGGAFTVCLQS